MMTTAAAAASTRKALALVVLRRATLWTRASATSAAATAFPRMILTTSMTIPRRSYSSNDDNQDDSGIRRLRRPNPSSSMRDSTSATATTNISAIRSRTAAAPSSRSSPPPFGLRHNAITIFPGDFSDSYEPWKDDDDWQEDSDGDDDDDDDDSHGIRAAAWSPEVDFNKEDDDDDEFDDYKIPGMEAMEPLTLAFAKRAQTDANNRKRWIANAQPPVLHSIVDERGRAYGRGGRKTATARCWIQAGCGQVVVNRLDFINYFIRPSDREHVLQPLIATETIGHWDVQLMVRGGGLTGQAGAARLALSNALNAYNPHVFRPVLKKLGLLTRDARIVERKKVGHKKARKSPQWVRR